jgi:hypothetical protein
MGWNTSQPFPSNRSRRKRSHRLAGGDLRRGMKLEEYGGKLTHLISIVRKHRRALTVYNFEVAGTHTYFAGLAHVLVHNCGEGSNPLENVKYSEKVDAQMSQGPGEYHSFPGEVESFASQEHVSIETGVDGNVYTHVRIPGGYGDEEGLFHFVVDQAGEMTHRFFEAF